MSIYINKLLYCWLYVFLFMPFVAIANINISDSTINNNKYNTCSNIFNIDDIEVLSNKCNMWHNLTPEFLQKNTNTLQAQTWMQCYAISPNGRFRVHYDTIGINSVSLEDLNNNGIPDYIDTVCSIFDYVYKEEVDEMGFISPKTDAYDANNYLYDIYVEEMATNNRGYYGECVPFKRYENDKYYSYIRIDNNYSINDSIVVDGKKRRCFYTLNSDAIKVTAAHEFFHAIQLAYRSESVSICEMSSVCMEIILYPEIYDYLQYVNAMTKNINSFVFGNVTNNSYSFYSYGIFIYMLYQKYNLDIIRDLWDGINKGSSSYKSLDSCLRTNYQSSLEEEWKDFCKWIYYSGSRSIMGEYFSFASKVNDLQPTDKLEFYQKENYVSFLEAYQICFVRVIFPSDFPLITADTADFLLTNLNTDGVIKQYLTPRIQYVLSINNKEFNNSSDIFFNKYWYLCTSQSEYANYLMYLYPGSSVKNISSAFPQPFSKDINKFIYFPVPNFLELGANLQIKILDMSLKEIASERTEVTIYKKNRVATLEPNLPKGAYIYIINAGGTDEIIGKFLVN